MIRSSLKDQPIYREVLRHAFRTAWHDRRYWILALLAGILLTAGSYDILWNAVTSITSNGNTLTQDVGSTLVQVATHASGSSFQNIISIVGGLEILLFFILVIISLATVSCIAQGGLVFALGAKRHGQDATLAESFRVGARALWPVIALNTLAFALIWILRFLTALPLYLALQQTSTTSYLVYLLSFIVFVPLAFLIAIIQIFSLNGMILQGAPLADALRRSYLLFKRHWVVVVETAVIQAAISVAIWFLFLLGSLIILIPSFVLFLSANVIQSNALFILSLVVGGIFFFVALIATAAFTIQLQYATWTYVYRRLGEGGVVPKIHRLIRNVFGTYDVPQS